MATETQYSESAWLAEAVRSLAADVHKLTARGAGDPHEIAALASRIDMVRDHLPERTTPLHRWLDGLRQQVAAMPVGEPACV